MPEKKRYTSKVIQEEINEQRRRKGLPEIPAINPKGAGTSTLARKDKSWNSVLDFFIKLIRRNG